jgi:hypothetical protein
LDVHPQLALRALAAWAVMMAAEFAHGFLRALTLSPQIVTLGGRSHVSGHA